MSRARDMIDMLVARGVGTVSEDGVPTGALVQSGSNANGSFLHIMAVGRWY